MIQRSTLFAAITVFVGALVAQTPEELRTQAEQGNASAQFRLGASYAQGEGVPQNYPEAIKWFRLAAEQGDADAQFGLGVVYSQTEGVPQDYTEAAKWYRLAAEQGDAEAQSNLGVMYHNGRGVPQDYTEAVKWLRLGPTLHSPDFASSQLDVEAATRSTRSKNRFTIVSLGFSACAAVRTAEKISIRKKGTPLANEYPGLRAAPRASLRCRTLADVRMLTAGTRK